MAGESAQALSQTNFSHWDWVIVAGYLAVSVIIGLLVKRFAVSMKNYITAGRGLGTWLGVATMTGTELGLITVMYSAEKGFKGGFAAFHIALVAGIVTLMVGLSGLIVAPLRREGVLTIPEYYQRRYNKRVRVLGGVVLAFGGILNMGLFLKVGSLFLVGITGLSESGMALPLVMTALLILVLFYTVLGGMISVVVTDYIQFVVLSFGLILVAILAIAKVGWEPLFGTVQQQMGENGFNPLAAEGEFGPEYVLWMAMMGLVSCAVWPTAVARALAMESPEAVKRQYAWSSISFTIRFMVPNLLGICAFVFIVNQAPDLHQLFFPAKESGQEPMGSLYAMPIFLGRILPAGLIGLITAAMVAAFMSTHDSYLLCWSSVITQDVIAPLRKEPLSATSRVRLTRIIIIVLGGYILFWGLFYKGGDDIWDYMALTGAIYFTGAIPVLIGGLYWKRASSTGAFWSLIAGCAAVFGLEPLRARLGQTVLGILGADASRENALALFTSARMGLASIALTSLIFVAGSLLFPDKKR